MSDVIRLLPDSVANQIAAGEVIQRPASVVKELVENAVDAGATAIQVIVKDAGRTLIQVVDDGCGMSDTDARMAFERHATSKIERADDLYSLHTMGFRGEALASIAAVAQIDLRTKVKGAEVGTRLLISGSKVDSQEPDACAAGSNMMVKNLFFNVPVRRKFLKKDSVELSNIVKEFERLALVNPGLDMSLISNDNVIHQMRRSSLKQRISDLFGKGLEKQLIPVSTTTSIVSIDGFICRPEYARKRNPLQFLTVNGRHMRHPYFHKAIMQCFEPLISAEEQPNYFIDFTVEPQTIDVNIHPTKNEIKFENESAIWQILTAAVRESLGRFNAVPGIDFDAVDAPEIPVFNPNSEGEHGVEIDSTYNPFSAGVSTSGQRGGFCGDNSLRSTGTMQNWEQLYAGFMGESEAESRGSRLNSMPAEAMMPDDSCGLALASDGEVAEADAASIQVGNRYILSASMSGVMVIDQHRAHVRVLYERYRNQLSQGSVGSQRVMFPEVLHLTSAQNAILTDLAEALSKAGFDLMYLGDNAWSVNAVPPMLDGTNTSDTILRIVDDTAFGKPEAYDDLQERVALSMAKSAAINGGRRLSCEEREHLLAELLKLSSPNYTPDGLPVIRVISTDDLMRMFQ